MKKRKKDINEMQIQRRTTALAAGALGTALLATGCGSATGQGADGDSGTLTVAVSALAASTDPAAELSASYLRAVGAAEGLMKIQPDGSVEPELAESVTATGRTEWTVELDPERTFWSGSPVDAAAVKASLERATELNTLAAGQLTGVEIEVADADTLTLRTQGPKPALPYALAHYQLVIHNSDSFGSEVGAAEVDSVDLTGPYRITGFDSAREIRLRANDEWWGGEPGYDEVVVRAVSDAQSRAELALSGQADIVADLPSERAPELESAPGVELVTAAAANTVAAYLNPRSAKAPALADVRVRQALAWGVDRDELVQLATGGLVDGAGSWLSTSPAVPGARDQGFTAYDAKRSGELLDAAGWELVDGVRTKDGRPLTLRLLTFGAEEATGEVLQAQWKKLGVRVRVSNVENTLVSEAVESGDWDAVTQAWTTLGDHAALLAGQIGPAGSANHAGLAPAGVPGLIAKANTAASDEARTAALLGLNQVIVDQVPLVPLHPRAVATAVSADVGGFAAHPLQYETLVTALLEPAA